MVTSFMLHPHFSFYTLLVDLKVCGQYRTPHNLLDLLCTFVDIKVWGYKYKNDNLGLWTFYVSQVGFTFPQFLSILVFFSYAIYLLILLNDIDLSLELLWMSLIFPVCSLQPDCGRKWLMQKMCTILQILLLMFSGDCKKCHGIIKHSQTLTILLNFHEL